MSDHFVRVIPTDPWLVPAPDAQRDMLLLLQRHVQDADDLTIWQADVPQFIDCGANFERVVCHACGTLLTGWWQQAMDRAFGGDVPDLSITTPCCGTPCSLNNLRYEWPSGFARFVIELRNPNPARLPSDLLVELGRVGQCAVRQILAHL